MDKTTRKRSKKNRDSWSLFLDTLTEIGCQYKLVKNDTNKANFYTAQIMLEDGMEKYRKENEQGKNDIFKK